MCRFFIRWLAIGAILCGLSSARAGLYHADVLLASDIDEEGYADGFPLDSFLTLLSIAGEADYSPEKTEFERQREIGRVALVGGVIAAVPRPERERHKELVRAIENRRKKGIGNLAPQDVVAQSADLLRLRREASAVNEALNLLQPLTRRPPAGYEFLILAHQSHAHLLRRDARDFPEVYDLHYSAVKDYDFPKSIPGLTPSQLRWYQRLERDYYLLFLKHRRDEAAKRKPNIHDALDPIFPGGGKKGVEPVRFVGESGQYEPGTIAASEQAKLPRDAIAILQQMILWDPDDNRLWWQLGELYNAAGDVKSASRVFYLLLRIDGDRKYTNRELMDHSTAVNSALETLLEIEAQMQQARQRNEEAKKRAEDEKQRKAKEHDLLRRVMVGAGVGLVLLCVSYWQTREFVRRRQARRAKAAPRSINQVE